MLTFLLFPHLSFVVGASGAIYAIATAELVNFLVKRRLARRVWILALWMWILPMLVVGNPFGHISGAIIGGLFGWHRLRRQSQSEESET